MKSLNGLMGKRGFEVTDAYSGQKIYIIKVKINAIELCEDAEYRQIDLNNGTNLIVTESYEWLVEQVEI